MCQIKHIDGAKDRCLVGLDRVGLVLGWRCRTGEVIDFIDLEVDWLRHVVVDKFETLVTVEVCDVFVVPRREVIDANHTTTVSNQTVAQV